MALGLPITLALTATRDYPGAFTDIVTRMDQEVASARERYLLPLELGRWAYVVSSRSSCQLDIFSGIANLEFDRRHVFLKDVYGKEGDSASRLDRAIVQMNKSFEDVDDLWQNLRMLYDSYLLHLEKDEMDAIENAIPRLTREHDEMTRSVTATNTLVGRWRSCFELVLTEAGRRESKDILDERQLWITKTLPSIIEGVVEVLKDSATSRGRILDEGKALYTKHAQEWYQRSGTHLPTSEFCSTLAHYLDLLSELSRVEESQHTALEELKSTMKLLGRYTSTLSSDGEDITIEDVRESFLQYEVMWVNCARIGEHSSRLKKPLRENMKLLEKCRDRM